MTTYYLSSKSGNDSNNGTSSTQAWSSFSKLSGKLKAGDTVLLERGSDFDQTLTFTKLSGTVDLPITISSYGVGEAPILSADKGAGISATNSNYFIIENLTIQGTGGVGIGAYASSHWVMRNLTFENVGGANNSGAINFNKSSDILIQNNTLTDTHGDGVYMTSVNNVAVVNSAFLGVTGANADDIQISGTNALIAGNILTIDANSNSTKGNLVFQGENLYAHYNYLQGGSFGMSISADKVIIENNVIKDHTKYSWSSNVMLTDQITGDVADNISIKDNNFYNASRDINIDGKNTTPGIMTVNNLEISGNEFHDWVKAPLALNGTVLNGTFENNTSDKQGSFIYSVTSDTSHLVTQGNAYVPDSVTVKPAIVAPPPKTITIVASGSAFEGAPMLKLLVNGIVVGEQAVTALRSGAEKQTITFQIPTFSAGDTFSIKYDNDKYKVGVGDKNLYVHSVSMDGSNLNLKTADLTSDIFYLKKEGNTMFFSSNAVATFTSADVPESVLTKPLAAQPAWPKLEDILESDEHNIHYNGETHTVGATQQAAYGTGYTDLTSSLADLHQALGNAFS